ncbi:MAG: dolichol kinase [Ignavibacterium sp.]|nr:dolichol kinase [Ignavibacterium sp.]MCX7611880.1 dolichol kinase [Ignavibacterium sp.]MDW8375422.1 dolichol kinase [Ignavibacteriales bacterium]
MTRIDDSTISYRDELVRKLIHLSSLSIPTIYYFISRDDALLILGILSFLALIIDLGRYRYPKFGEFFYMIFGFLLRRHEKDELKKNLNGATYVLLSAFLGVLIFPKLIFINAFAILIISDSFAALIGRRYGTIPFLRKSLQGTLAFFISAIIVIIIAPKLDNNIYEYLIGIVAALVGAIVENISNNLVDDNLSIPLTIGFLMWGMYLIFLPELSMNLAFN